MQEEFHGDGIGGGKRKLLYGWGTMNVTVWLPSLSELVGIDSNQYDGTRGTYLSAMQEVVTRTNYWTDAQGGTQFAYFKQYNTSGGGQKIWDTCNRQMSWLRSTDLDNTTDSWRTTDAQNLNAPPATVSHAVHPAVGYRFKVSFSLYPLISKIDNTGRSWGRRPCSSMQVSYPSDWFSL